MRVRVCVFVRVPLEVETSMRCVCLCVSLVWINPTTTGMRYDTVIPGRDSCMCPEVDDKKEGASNRLRD